MPFGLRPKPATLGSDFYFFFSFFIFRFSFGLSWAFFCCSLLPLSFLPLSPISLSPCLKMIFTGTGRFHIYSGYRQLGLICDKLTVVCDTLRVPHEIRACQSLVLLISISKAINTLYHTGPVRTKSCLDFL